MLSLSSPLLCSPITSPSLTLSLSIPTHLSFLSLSPHSLSPIFLYSSSSPPSYPYYPPSYLSSPLSEFSSISYLSLPLSHLLQLSPLPHLPCSCPFPPLLTFFFSPQAPLSLPSPLSFTMPLSFHMHISQLYSSLLLFLECYNDLLCNLSVLNLASFYILHYCDLFKNKSSHATYHLILSPTL